MDPRSKICFTPLLIPEQRIQASYAMHNAEDSSHSEQYSRRLAWLQQGLQDTSEEWDKFRFGMPKIVIPAPPFSEDNPPAIWEKIQPRINLPDKLVPPPMLQNDSGWTYPQSPVWKLKYDNRYMAGSVFVSNLITSRIQSEERPHILSMATPSGVGARMEEGVMKIDPIPGMVRMPAGIPFVQTLDSDPFETVTVACVHTLKSLSSYGDYLEILEATQILQKYTWDGCPATENEPRIPPIYELPGLKLNDRVSSETKAAYQAALQDETHTLSVDGSYSLASTVEEGNGLGILKPAIQATSPAAALSISTVTQALHRLFRLIMPKCISKDEFTLWDFYSVDNNIFGFGGLEPNNSNLQMNVSSQSKGGNMEESIGRRGHFTLIARMRADPGAFLLARPGLYIREKDELIVWAIFKGNDLHGGNAPFIPSDEAAKWEAQMSQDLKAKFGVVKRVGYVSYPSMVASKRNTTISISPPIGFGNEPMSTSSSQMRRLNYTEHGRIFMGPPSAFYNRLVREQAMFQWNLTLKTYDLCMNLNQFLRSHTYKDENGVTHQCLPMERNPREDQDYFATMRASVQRMFNTAEKYSMRLTRDMLREAHLKLNVSSGRASNPLQIDRSNNVAGTVLSIRQQPVGPTFRTFRTEPDVQNLPERGHKRGRNSESSTSSSMSSNIVELNAKEVAKDPEEKEYEIQKILDFDPEGKRYLVHWAGFDDSHNSWVLRSDLNCDELLKEFLKNRSEASTSLTRLNSTSIVAIVNESYWRDRFNVEKLSEVLESLHHTNRSLSRFSSKMKNSTDWLRGLATQNVLNEKLSLLPPGVWSAESAQTVIIQLREMATGLPQLDSSNAVADTLKRGCTWEICRAWIVIYRWFIDTGPSLSEDLFHRLAELGDEAFQEQYPAFAQLVLQIQKYVNNIFDTKKRKGKSKPNAKKAKTIPADLFGLLPGKGKKLISLPTCPRTAKDKLQAQAADIFMQVISDHIVIDHIIQLDSALHLDRKQEHRSKCKDRAINIGGVLHTILNVFSGEDGVFASGLLDPILLSPTSAFPNLHTASLAAKIQKDPSVALSGLYETLTSIRNDNTQIEELCEAIGDQAWANFVLLDEGETLQRMCPKPVPGHVGRKGRRGLVQVEKVGETLAPEGPLSSDTLVHIDGSPFFGKIGLIIREVLNKRRDLPVGDPIIRSILDGQSATSGYQDEQVNLDFFDPVRCDNLYANCIRKALPPISITVPVGLARMMSYMSPGLGPLNLDFIERSNMQFASEAECVALFNKEIQDYETQTGTIQTRQKPYQNLKCWGQPCNGFAIHATVPSRKDQKQRQLTTKEKFEPYWKLEIQKSWVAYLGDLLNSDPSQYSGKRSFMESYNEMDRAIWIRAAFTVIYNHLDDNLNIADKETLNFGVIFVEHLLCKVTRYEYQCRSLKENFLTMSKKAQEAQKEWMEGANVNDLTGKLFPIPLTTAAEKIKISIQRSA
ncbi:hypothetical protein A0H81_01596 [Grifola frondosa]|uniref:Chromo domain-containing protein n=1 Tax=Grifola frondosa TaxID=5627 RepID=A0A1C7MPZ6_GRIFR|nr:hypothetical protein A0H81_01596 [Grifola frondosa]